MTAEVELRPPGPAITPAQLAAPFAAFVLVCDRDKTVGPRAALAFRAILERGGAGAGVFARMLRSCGDNYAALWREYAGARLQVGLPEFLELLRGLVDAMPANEYAELEHELEGLGHTLFRAGFRLRPRPAQRRAFEEFVHVLRTRTLPQGAEAARRDPPAPAAEAPAPPVAPAVPAASAADILAVPPDPGRAPLPEMPAPGDTWVHGSVKLVCAQIVDEARNVKTFSFTGRSSTWFRYQPGQFVTIEPVIDGKRVPRSYTISSSPTRPARLEITVKRVPGGVVSNWLHDHLRVGHELDAKGPFGKFTCLRAPREKYLFLAAGSGITPLMSMARYLHDVAAPVDVIFLQSAATTEDIVFRKELALIRERHPGFRVEITVTDASADEAWDGLRGRLDNDMLLRIAPDLAERMVLACGPPPFMEKAKQLLSGNGFPLETQFDEESFIPRPTKPSAGAPEGASSGRVRFARSGKAADLAPGETILEAAERCGVALPSSCRQGRCGSCRAQVLSGAASMAEPEALTAEEIAGGAILACIAECRSGELEVDC